MPFSVVLAPPIRTFRGEMYLHYPANFLLIPELSSFIRSFLTVILGALLSGTAVLMISQVYLKKKADLKKAFTAACGKYGSLLCIILFMSVILHYAYKLLNLAILSYFSAGHVNLFGCSFNVWRGPISIFLSIVLLLIVQAIFVYSLPILLIGEQKLFVSISKSAGFFLKNIWQTLCIVTLPFFLYIPIIIFQYKTSYLIDNFFPEIVLYIAYASIVLSSLIIDVLVTVSSAMFYLNNRETK
jgi:hypothetical protein